MELSSKAGKGFATPPPLNLVPQLAFLSLQTGADTVEFDTVTHEEVKAAFEANTQLGELTWAEITRQPFLYRLLENQVLAGKQDNANPVAAPQPLEPVSAPAWGTCFLNEYDLSRVFMALQTARHAINHSSLSNSSRLDALDQVTRACQLLSSKAKPAKSKKHHTNKEC